jgi:hypothetical protein
MLGEELVTHGVINEKQLDKALKAQLVHGGHLGTCLIELDYIDEQRLGEALATILGVKHAEPTLFHSIPDAVLETVSRDLAEKHSVVPLRLVDRTLHVAMIAPKDLMAIDELQFATGYQVQAWVAPEVRIVLALENYYGVPRSRRFLLLSPDPFVIPRSEAPEAHAKPATQPREAPVWEDLSPDPEYAAQPLQNLSDAIDEVGDAMCAALDTGQLGAAIVECLALGLERTILFRVHRQVARVWDSRGFDSMLALHDDVALPVLDEPVFKLLGGNGAYLGPPTNVPGDSGIYKAFDIELPARVLLVPVYVEDHLVAMLYGDSGPNGRLEGNLADYQRVAHKIGPALEIQALARRVRRI